MAESNLIGRTFFNALGLVDEEHAKPSLGYSQGHAIKGLQHCSCGRAGFEGRLQHGARELDEFRDVVSSELQNCG